MKTTQAIRQVIKVALVIIKVTWQSAGFNYLILDLMLTLTGLYRLDAKGVEITVIGLINTMMYFSLRVLFAFTIIQTVRIYNILK